MLWALCLSHVWLQSPRVATPGSKVAEMSWDSKKVTGSNPGPCGPLCVEFACPIPSLPSPKKLILKLYTSGDVSLSAIRQLLTAPYRLPSHIRMGQMQSMTFPTGINKIYPNLTFLLLSLRATEQLYLALPWSVPLCVEHALWLLSLTERPLSRSYKTQKKGVCWCC